MKVTRPTLEITRRQERSIYANIGLILLINKNAEIGTRKILRRFVPKIRLITTKLKKGTQRFIGVGNMVYLLMSIAVSFLVANVIFVVNQRQLRIKSFVLIIVMKHKKFVDFCVEIVIRELGAYATVLSYSKRQRFT